MHLYWAKDIDNRFKSGTETVALQNNNLLDCLKQLKRTSASPIV